MSLMYCKTFVLTLLCNPVKIIRHQNHTEQNDIISNEVNESTIVNHISIVDFMSILYGHSVSSFPTLKEHSRSLFHHF